MKSGLQQICLVAELAKSPFLISDVVVIASDSNVSITGNLIPATRYPVPFEEISKSNELRDAHYVTTAKGGEFSKVFIANAKLPAYFS